MNYHKLFCKPLFIITLTSFFLFNAAAIRAQGHGKSNLFKESGFNGSVPQAQSNVRLNEINTLAFRHFHKNNPNVEQEFWEKTHQGFIAHFKDSDKSSFAYYDNQGAFLYSVKYFEESDLNIDLQKRLKREYPGFQFDILTEINNEIKSVYLVTLKNKYAMKSLLIDQGEIRVIDDLNYAGL
jgi:hypothetical protein